MRTTKKCQALFVGLLLGLLIQCESVLAAPKNSLTSDAQVDVLEGSTAVVPPKFGIDPEDPNEEGTENTGLLKIDRVPNFSFGKVVASGLYQAEFARNTNPYIQVSDLRGSLGGWTLYVKASDFVSKRIPTDTKKYVLNGASLKLNQGVIEGYDSEYGAPPESYDVAINKEYQKVLQADTNTGQGIWASRWQTNEVRNDNIELAVLPETAEPGRDYEATLYWKLTDVPMID